MKNLVKFMAWYENSTEEWACKFLSNAGSLSHDGDCVGRSAVCSLCMIEKYIRLYREHSKTGKLCEHCVGWFEEAFCADNQGAGNCHETKEFYQEKKKEETICM